MAYAEGTTVSPARSRAEIEDILVRYGASGFMYAWQHSDEGLREEIIRFEADGRHLLFSMPMPHPNEKRFTHTPERGTKRSESQAYKEWEKECKRKWRALALAVKAKLEVVESGIATFEEEFMSHIVMPDGRTVGQHIIPSIAEAYTSGKMPKMLPAMGETE